MQRKLSKWLQISDLKSLDDVDRINTPRQVLYHGSPWNMIMRKCLVFVFVTRTWLCLWLEDSQISLWNKDRLEFPKILHVTELHPYPECFIGQSMILLKLFEAMSCDWMIFGFIWFHVIDFKVKCFNYLEIRRRTIFVNLIVVWNK